MASIPNQNNLFDIFQDLIKHADELGKTIITSGVATKNFTTNFTLMCNNMKLAVTSMVELSALIKNASLPDVRHLQKLNTAYNSIGEFVSKLKPINVNNLEPIQTSLQAIGGVFNSLSVITSIMNQPQFSSVRLMIYRIRIWGIGKTLKSINRMIMRFTMDISFNPVLIKRALDSLEEMKKIFINMGLIVTEINKVTGVDLLFARIRLKRIAKVLFGRVGDFDSGDFGSIIRRLNLMSKVGLINASLNAKLMNIAMMSLVEIIIAMSQINYVAVLKSSLTMRRVRRLFYGRPGLIGDGFVGLLSRVGLKNKQVLIKALINLKLMQISAASLADMVNQLGRINFIRVMFATKSVRRIHILLFGRTGVGGLMRLFRNIGLRSIKIMGASIINIVFMKFGVKRLVSIVRSLALMALLMPLAILGALGLKLVVKLLVSSFRLIGLRHRSIRKGAKTLMFISMSLITFIASLAVAGLAITLIIPGILAMMLTITSLVLFIVVIGRFEKHILKGMGVFFVISIGLIVFSVGLLILSIALSKLDFKSFFVFLSFTVALVGIVALLGTVLFVPVLLGSVALMALSVALILFSMPLLILTGAIDKLSKMNAPEDSLSKVITIFVNGIKAIFEGDNYKYLNPITLSLAMVTMGQLSLIALSVGMMAGVLQDIAALNMPTEWNSKGKPTKWRQMSTQDFTNAAINASTIITFFTAMMDDKPTKLANGVVVGGISEAGLENVTVSTRRKMRRLRFIASSIGKMATTLSQIARLTMPTTVDNNGKLGGWKLMDASDFKNASLNAIAIASIFTAMFADEPTDVVLGDGSTTKVNPISMASLDKVTLGTRIKMRMLNKIVGSIGGMATTVSQMARLVVPDYTAGVDENGNPKAWRPMQSEDFIRMGANASVLTTIFASLFDDKSTTHTLGDGTIVTISPISESALENITRKTKRKMKRLGTIVGAISGIAEVVKQMSMLRFPDTFNSDGSVASYTEMKASHIKGMTENITKMVEVFAKLFADTDAEQSVIFSINGRPEKVTFMPLSDDVLDNLSRSAAKKMGRMGEMVSTISSMTEIIGNIGGKTALNWKDITNTITNTIITVPNVLIRLKNKHGWTDESFGNWTSQIKNLSEANTIVMQSIKDMSGVQNIPAVSGAFEKYTNNTVKLIDKVNGADLEKLKTAGNLMQNLAKFSTSINGNFDKLADTISKKLVDALTELNETLDKTNEELKKDVQPQLHKEKQMSVGDMGRKSSTGSATGQAPGGTKPGTKPGTKQEPVNIEKLVEQIIDVLRTKTITVEAINTDIIKEY